MMIVLLLLSACVCLGLADYHYAEKQYGKTFRWMIPEDTRSLEFAPKDNSKATVLWTLHVEKGWDAPFSVLGHKPPKGTVGLHWGYLELSYLTQEDSGLYTMRDNDKKLLRTVSLEVVANTMSYELSARESLDFTFDLEPNSCNIYFIPESDLKLKRFGTKIVRQGRLERKDSFYCSGFQLSKPCGILIKSLQSSCGGRFEVRDQNDNKALVVSLEVKPLQSSDVGFGIFIFSLVLSVLAFVFVCCCGKRPSKEDDSETEAAAASAPEDELVGPRSDELSQPFGTHYPAQPSYTPTGPLVHDPTDNVPPSYSEVAASAEQAAVPSALVYSDVEPQFELKGMTFPSDSANVYTSDKLNFL
ncbi:uncharacterized protein LOC122991109 isoform X2 [Thunnus albacares]|uniref:uncharacterized protein LOC122991109 isoform X1 n=1 Tax=Thunnus albacares TaxID=8236 RepID=UPI001CF60C55|nr:uncharacterized protein LOC122991109 isoform X1 [Thunnus albacares]XP_044220680.1 uncharacterized protein LOC122991109 isoform X2 [Thunnus albacares]